MKQFVLYISCYGLFNFLYFQIPDQFYSDVLYHFGVVAPCANLINGLAPLEHVAAVQNHLLSGRADLVIVRGCDSAGVLFLLSSAVLAFKASVRQKLLGLLFGVGIVYSLNIVRLVGLYFVEAYRREWFEFAHLYMAPTLMLLAAFIFFAWWAMGCRNDVKLS